MSKDELVSVIIPTYNRKEMLLNAIRSVKKQKGVLTEIIVIDDNSDDGTSEAIKSLVDKKEVKYFRNNKNMGPGFNRNLGFKESKGCYVVFMDDDDEYTDEFFFERAIDELEKNKTLSVVSSNARTLYLPSMRTKDGDIGLSGFKNGRAFIYGMGNNKYNKPLSTFSSVFRKSTLLKVDLANMKMVNDYAIYLRALTAGNIFVLPGLIVGNYRMHDSNISNNITMDFIIQNLDERKWVYDRLVEEDDNTKRVNSWWNSQMLKLLKYYTVDSNPSYRDSVKVYRWIIKNSPKSLSLRTFGCALIIAYKPLALVKKAIRKIK